MERTKDLSLFLLGACIAAAWIAGNIAFWVYMVRNPFWGIVGMIFTTIVLPALAQALLLDLTERKP